MSEPTGNEKPVEQPWEMSWVKKPIQAVTEFVNKAVDAVKEPWEMPWQKKATPVSTPPEKPAVAPSKGFSVDEYIQKTAVVESGNNPNAKAKKSSAVGLYQFTASTWMDMVNRMDLPYTLMDRKDPKKSEEVMRKFTEMNYEKAKKDLGREPTNVDVYMYHFLGNNASTLLKAKGDEVAYKQVSPAQARANKPVFFHEDGTPKTVNQVLERYMGKFGNGEKGRI